MSRIVLTLFLLICSASPAFAALQTKTVDYSYNGKAYKGYLAWDDSFAGKRPGVMVVHDFWGLNDYARSRAEQLAKLGFVAFAADMYGGGRVGAHPKEASAMMSEVRQNLQEWLGRANAALKVLREQPTVDPAKIAAIGYCFGGATVLQLAYSGADLAGVVSFHGALVVPQSTQDIKTKILILHGGKDANASEDTIRQLKAALDQGKVDYKFVVYPDAVHSFTVPGSEKMGNPNNAYNAEADTKSWQEMLSFFQRIFGTS